MNTNQTRILRDGPPSPDSLAPLFPPGFRWGAATAAAQIEGGFDADGKAPSIWDTFSRVPGAVANGDTLDVADDHYHRWQEDLTVMAQLGLDSYRFSVAWPRVVPERGRIEKRGLAFYDRLVDGLLARGIDPFLTLYHWDLPQWLEDAGGWPARGIVAHFEEYAVAVAEVLGDRVRHWSTFNEPWVFVFNGYLTGTHAPGIRSEAAAVDAAHHVLLAHGTAVRRWREILPRDASIGIALSVRPKEPEEFTPVALAATARAEAYDNDLFIEPIVTGAYPALMPELFACAPPVHDDDMALIAEPIDFIGLNFYRRNVVSATPVDPVTRAENLKPEGIYTDMNWEVWPQGLETILLEFHRKYPGHDLYVTESGSAWQDEVRAGRVADALRTEYLAAHLASCANAIRKGAPVRGFFSWSLLDNFEWAEGYSKRFGLVHVDYETQRRTIKDSGFYYRDVIAATRSGR